MTLRFQPAAARGHALRSALLLLTLVLLPIVSGQGTKADYERARSFARRTENQVFRAALKPNWLPDQHRFWYRVTTGAGTHEFILVDANAGTRAPAFDHG